MPVGEEVTLGEIARNQVATRLDIAELRQEVAARPDWKDVQRVEEGILAKLAAQGLAQDSKNATQDLAITKLEGWGSWGTKVAGGIVIAAVLGASIVKPGG